MCVYAGAWPRRLARGFGSLRKWNNEQKQETAFICLACKSIKHSKKSHIHSKEVGRPKCRDRLVETSPGGVG